jgi:sulfatase modifying factor 1
MRFGLFALILAALPYAWAQAVGPAAASPLTSRKALVIGNSNYPRMGNLPSAAADARLVADALGRAGFKTRVVIDADREKLRQGIDSFVDGLQEGDVAAVAFFGRGLQVDRENYLAPVDFDPASQQSISVRAYSLSALRDLIQDTKVALGLFIVDGAAPDSPPSTVAVVPGLAAPGDLHPGTWIALSTQPGKLDVAAGKDGLFASAVANALDMPGASLDSVERAIETSVNRASNGAQLPSLVSALVPDFYFHAPVAAPVVAAASEPAKTEPQAPAPGLSRTNRKDRLDYVWVPPGEFEMGCVENDNDCDADEKPRHSVKISHGFWMSKTEVTVRAYQSYVDSQKQKLKMPPASPSTDPKWRFTDRPIINVTWEQAEAFCTWTGGSLPTEAQWEYAARGGQKGNIYPWGNDISRDRANYDGAGGNDRWTETSPVGSFDANPLGLFDMAGNVWELTRDWYQKDYYQMSPVEDPPGPAASKEHVARGGSWFSSPKQLRTSIRRRVGISERANHIGFRCILENIP